MGSDAVIQNYRVANEKWKSLSSCGHKNCDDQLDIKGQGILGGLRSEKSAVESCCLIWYWWPIAAAEEVLLGSLVRHRPPALSLLSPSRKWIECRRRRRDEEEPAKRDQSRLLPPLLCNYYYYCGGGCGGRSSGSKSPRDLHKTPLPV